MTLEQELYMLNCTSKNYLQRTCVVAGVREIATQLKHN